LSHIQKDFIFTWLSAQQKIYRKIRQLLFDKNKDRLIIARNWFNRSIDQLKTDECIPKGNHEIPQYIREFIEIFLHDKMEEAKQLGRCIVLDADNADILRILHTLIAEYENLRKDSDTINAMYHCIYQIMEEYHDICEQQLEYQQFLDSALSSVSRQTRESEALALSIPHSQMPILGRKVSHDILPETVSNLFDSHLQHLCDIWPIPSLSQEIFNAVCRIKPLIPQSDDHMVSQLLGIRMEKFLKILLLGISINQLS
jgi:hypothetical protein